MYILFFSTWTFGLGGRVLGSLIWFPLRFIFLFLFYLFDDGDSAATFFHLLNGFYLSLFMSIIVILPLL